MSQPDEQRPKKPLISVEWQREVDVSTGRGETRMFVKMYFEARDSGLLAALDDRLWKTLCCLATYVDENGNCYPSQARLARDLGISRQKTNKRVRDLLAFRFQGKPIITVSKNRENTPQGGRWANNVYHLRPITGFSIFDEEAAGKSGETPMSPKGDTGPMSPPMSPKRDTRKGDTNKNQVINQTTHTPVCDSSPKEEEARQLVGTFREEFGHSSARPAKKRELEQAVQLLSDHGPEKAAYVIRFAAQEAKTTNFRPRFFGAILDYAPEALENFDSAQRLQRRRQDEDARRREEERQIEAERDAYRKMPPEERARVRLRRKEMMIKAVDKRELDHDEREQLYQEILADELGGNVQTA